MLNCNLEDIFIIEVKSISQILKKLEFEILYLLESSLSKFTEVNSRSASRKSQYLGDMKLNRNEVFLYQGPDM